MGRTYAVKIVHSFALNWHSTHGLTVRNPSLSGVHFSSLIPKGFTCYLSTDYGILSSPRQRSKHDNCRRWKPGNYRGHRRSSSRINSRPIRHQYPSKREHHPSSCRPNPWSMVNPRPWRIVAVLPEMQQDREDLFYAYQPIIKPDIYKRLPSYRSATEGDIRIWRSCHGLHNGFPIVTYFHQ